MKNLFFFVSFLFTKFCAYSQNLNSLPYQGKSLITVNNHLLNIEGLNNDELVEKIYDLSEKIVKAQKSGYANTAILDSMVNLQHQLREEYTTRVAKEKIKATNPYSGQSEMLTPEEHKLYIEIKEAELNEDYKTMQKGLDKFSRLNAKAYMTLLD